MSGFDNHRSVIIILDMGKRVIGNPKLAVAVYRTSKDEQSLGIDAQQASVQAWAAAHGVQVVAWRIEQGVTSRLPLDERTGLLEAIAALRETGAGVLVAAKRDRLGRDIELTREVERRVRAAGARVHAVSSGANGDSADDAMMRGLEDLFAERERAKISDRTREALAAKKSKGQRIGCVPYGYTPACGGCCSPPCQCRLIPLDSEQAVITRVRSMNESGYRICDIVDALTRQGIVGRTGKPLARTQVVNMLSRLLAA